jgi:hypothetical protein
VRAWSSASWAESARSNRRMRVPNSTGASVLENSSIRPLSRVLLDHLGSTAEAPSSVRLQIAERGPCDAVEWGPQLTARFRNVCA